MSINTEIAYIAGLLDGEGTISLFESDNSFMSRIAIYNTNKKVIHWCKKHFGGSVHSSDRKVTKICYIWLCKTADQKAFIELVLPYLIIKPKQARLLLQFRKDVCVGTPTFDTVRYKKLKRNLISRCRKLNKRGR